MGMERYLDYLQNMAETPEESYQSLTQAWVDAQWKDTTLLKTVDEETEVGSNIFLPIEVWKNTVSEFDINVLKNAKDFRRLMFKSVKHPITRGRKYRFNNNFWLTYEETNEEEPYCEILVRRCNNIAKWVDTETGAIIEEPCILDYTLSATNPKKDKDVIVAGGSVALIVQGNERTHKLEPNQRFIFSGKPYKYVAINNYMQNNYVTNEVPLLFLDCDLDMVQPDDDLRNNIANRGSYNYSINIIQDNTEQVNGFKGKLDIEVKFNDEVVSRNVIWESNQFATVSQNGEYILTGNVGDIAQIKAYIDGNTSVYDIVDITIVNAVSDEYDLIIEPIYTKIYQNKINTFTVTLHKNGVPQTDIVTYTTSGVDKNKYELTQYGNTFTLIGLNYSGVPLTITFASGNQTKSIDVQLKSAF